MESTIDDYLRAADALEREMMADAIAWGKIARGLMMPFDISTAAEARTVRKAARRIEVRSWKCVGRCGEARKLYESICTLPLPEIVLRMCEAGYNDHAWYIAAGDWAAPDDTLLAA